MAETPEIGLAAVMEMDNFNKGMSQYRKTVDQASAETQKKSGLMGRAFQSAGGIMTNAIGTAVGVIAGTLIPRLIGSIVSIVPESINAASDLRETYNKVQVVFGDAADQIVKFSENAASALGQSQQAALDAASTFGVFGKAAGLTGGDLGDFAGTLTGLASDLASFYNTKPEEAVYALGAALRGEAEPMRKYGVLLNEMTLKEKALEMGLISTTKTALTPAQKVMAAYGVIMDQTADAQGDFARTSTGLANAQRIVAAKMANLKTTLGSALLPLVEVGANLLANVIIPLFSDKLAPILEKIVPRIAAVAEGFGKFISILMDAGFGSIEMGEFLGSIFGPERAAQIQGFVTGLIDTIKSIASTIGSVFQTVFAIIGDLFGGQFGVAIDDFREGLWGIIPPGLLDMISGFMVGLKDLWENTLQPVLAIMADYFRNAIPLAIGILSDFWTKHLLPAFSTLTDAFQKNIAPMLANLRDWLAEFIPAAVQKASDVWLNVLWPALGRVFDFIGQNVIPVLTNVAVWLMENIPVAIARASEFWTGTLQPALANVWAFIQQNVIPILQDVWTWLQENVPVAIQTASDFWNDTLLPALENAWAYFSENIMPIIQDVIDIIAILGEIALVKLAEFWNVTLLPALQEVWKYFNEKILPVLKDVYTFIAEEIGPKIEWFTDKVIKPLAAALNEGLAKAIGYVKGLLDSLLLKLQEFREGLKGVPIIGQSPSPLEVSLVGIAHAAVEATLQISELGKAIGAVNDIDDIFQLGQAFGTLGGAVAGRFQKKRIDPLKAQIEQVDQVLENLRLAFDAAFAAGNYEQQLEIYGLIMQYENQRVDLAEKYAAEQQKILALQKAQEDLAFLKAQMDFLKLIKDEGLDITSILGGLKLGLDADLPSLMEAMTIAIQQMIRKANEELEIGSPSGVFEDIGANVMRGFTGGINRLANLPALAMGSSLPRLAMAAHPVTTSASYRNNSVNFYGTQINNGMGMESLKQFILQTVGEGV